MPVSNLNILSGISHELHDTILLMNHSLERLEHTYPKLQYYPCWQDTKQNCGYIQTLVNRLSIWQQSIGSNRVPIHFEELIRSLYLTVSNLAETNERRIIYCCHRNIPPVYAIKKQLKQSLLALLQCRLRICPEQSCLRIDLNRIEEQVVLRITDSGPSPEQLLQPTLNDILSQMTYTAEQNNGHFSYQTSPSGGCVCTLMLPIQNEKDFENNLCSHFEG